MGSMQLMVSVIIISSKPTFVSGIIFLKRIIYKKIFEFGFKYFSRPDWRVGSVLVMDPHPLSNLFMRITPHVNLDDTIKSQRL
jgi:hypothetical protein